MSAIAALCGRATGVHARARLAGILAAMPGRGANPRIHQATAAHPEAGAVLGVIGHEWEDAAVQDGAVGIAVSGPSTLVADATLVHRSDLLRAIESRG